MPKETFHNLPDAKKQRIISAILDEFAEYTYDNASVNRIVASCNIAKGSFYQYFEDKKDLYLYLIELLGQEKLTYITPAMSNPFNHDFDEVFKDIFYASLKFAKEHPKFMQMGLKLLSDRSHPIFQEVMMKNEALAVQFYAQFLRKSQESGKIREDIDLEFSAKILYTLTTNLVDYDKLTEEDNWEIEIQNLVEKLMNFISFGLSNVKS